MGKKKYEIAEVNNVDVLVDISRLMKSDSLMFHANPIANHFGKDLSNFIRMPSTREYMALIIADSNSVICTENELVLSRRGRDYGGTWLHQDMALKLARWCSTEFEYKLDKWIIRRIKDENDRQIERDKARMHFRPMTDAIQDDHEDTQGYHYSNEADMINLIAVGLTAKEIRKERGLADNDDTRDALTYREIALVEKLQQANTTLIEIGLSFSDRKATLADLAKKPPRIKKSKKK